MYSYKLNIQVEEDLTRIFEYVIGQFGLEHAVRYYEMFFECFSKIASNPFLFPNGNHYKKDIAIVFVELTLFFIK